MVSFMITRARTIAFDVSSIICVCNQIFRKDFSKSKFCVKIEIMSSNATLNRKKVCTNPFGRKNAVQMTNYGLDDQNSALTSSDYICDTCRNQLRSLPDGIAVVSSNSEDAEKPDESFGGDIGEDIEGNADDKSFFSKDAAVDSLNKFLNEVDISPIKEEQLRLKQYCNSKMSDIFNVLKTTIFEKYEPDKTNNGGDVMLQQLKHKIAQSSDRKEKVKLLTLVPRTWSTAKIAHEFPGKISDILCFD